MQEEPKKLKLDWSAVEKALAEGTFSGYKIGIIETEKLFASFLKNKKVPGRNADDRIKYVSRFLSQGEQLKFSREIYKKIIEKSDCQVTLEETKQTVRGYWQAMLDLEEAIGTLSVSQKYEMRLKYLSKKTLEKIRTIAMAAAGLIGLTAFFYETSFGRHSALAIGRADHFLIFKIGPWVLGIVIAAILIWIAMKLLKKRREF
ncbi:MAG: hypothetical protein PHQ47_00440 [Candidatus Portnoybacteria bacterium]|nr:hypothetical protein [Candidatus Portnoybacteria bacterium]